MKTEIQPQDSTRAEAFRLWMSSPMPMVTLVKTMDVCRLVKVSRKSDIKFTTLMCWCIGKAASQMEEFFMLPEGGRLFRYDCLLASSSIMCRWMADKEQDFWMNCKKT